MKARPRVLVLTPPSLYQQLFLPDVDAELRTIAEVTFNQDERNLSASELAAMIGDFDAVVTGWGSPSFDEEVLASANRLRLIAHSAGSIKKLLPPPVFARGIAVTHAASAIAPAVAEMTLLLILLCLRQVHRLDRLLKAGAPWQSVTPIPIGQELAGQRVGVVGAGYTGRRVIDLLIALAVEVWVHDPYLTATRAAELGVKKVGLHELFAGCPIVTLQAPPTAETYHMVGESELRLLQDGAILVNTARSHLVDQNALLTELRTGRIQAALDVFDQEPLPVDSPFRQLENVVITPHVAGASQQARARQGKVIVEEIRSFFAHETLRYEVTQQMLDTMA